MMTCMSVKDASEVYQARAMWYSLIAARFALLRDGVMFSSINRMITFDMVNILR